MPGKKPDSALLEAPKIRVACHQAQHQRMLQPEQRQVFALIRLLTIGGYLQGGFSAEQDLIECFTLGCDLPAKLGHAVSDILEQAFHSCSAVIELLVIVETKAIQVLKKLENNIPCGPGIVYGNLQLMPRSAQRGIADGILIQLLIRDPLRQLSQHLAPQVFRDLSELIHLPERLGDS